MQPGLTPALLPIPCTPCTLSLHRTQQPCPPRTTPLLPSPRREGRSDSPGQRLACDGSGMACHRWQALADGHPPHEANAPVEAFAADYNMLGALCLLWSVATGSLPALDAATLVQRDPNHQWSTYQSAMHDLVTFLASAPANAAQDLQQRAAALVAPYGTFLRAVFPDAFLQLLAWDEDLKWPVHRIPLLHWLLIWQAPHNRSTLRCQIVADDKTQLPAPCPLSLQQCKAELTRHKSALTFPGILSRIAIKLAELSNPSGSTEPPWRRMLTRPDQLSSSLDFTADIERLASTPDDRAEHIAQIVRVMCADLAVPDSSMTTLRSVQKARALASAVKTVWLASGTGVRQALQANLTDLITTVEEQHGTAGMETARLSALTTLDPIFECVHPGLVWSSVAPALLAVQPPVVPPVASDWFLNVRDPITIRQATSQAVQANNRPQQLDCFIADLRKALDPPTLLSSVYASFERRPGHPLPVQAPPPSAAAPANPLETPSILPGPAQELPAAQTGLLPPSQALPHKVVRLRGLRSVADVTQLSTALTHNLGTPITVPPTALKEGAHFVSLPSSVFQALFASLPARTYVDPHHGYTIHIGSCTAVGEPFYLPDSPAPPRTSNGLKRPKNSGNAKRAVQMPAPPTNPPPGFLTTPDAAASAATNRPPPAEYSAHPWARDTTATAYRGTLYHGSRYR